MKKKAKDYLTLAAIVLIPVLVAAMIVGIPSREQPEQGQQAGYSMTVAHSGTPGDASYSVTLYGPDGEPVLRLDAYHVAGTFEEPGYSYGFTWLDDVDLNITETWGNG